MSGAVDHAPFCDGDIVDRIVGFLFLAWLVVMGIGLVIALMPVIAFLAGFGVVLLLFVFLGRLVASLFW